MRGPAVVDLHGLSASEARAAVLCCLAAMPSRMPDDAEANGLAEDLTIITGDCFCERQTLDQGYWS